MSARAHEHTRVVSVSVVYFRGRGIDDKQKIQTIYGGGKKVYIEKEKYVNKLNLCGVRARVI